jgi:hypothetical protein
METSLCELADWITHNGSCIVAVSFCNSPKIK